MVVVFGFVVMFVILIILVFVLCLYIVMSDVGNGVFNIFCVGYRVVIRIKLVYN